MNRGVLSMKSGRNPGISTTVGILTNSATSRSLALALGFSLSLSLGAALPQPSIAQEQEDEGADDDANSPFNLAPRSLRKSYKDAQECVPEKRFSEAARLLGRILDYQETPEDFFFKTQDDNEPVVRSLKTE